MTRDGFEPPYDFRRESWDAESADRYGDDLLSRSHLAYDAELED